MKILTSCNFSKSVFGRGFDIGLQIGGDKLSTCYLKEFKTRGPMVL